MNKPEFVLENMVFKFLWDIDWFGFFVFNGIYLCWLFNAKAILLEE